LTKSLPPHVLERHKAHLGLELEVLSRKLDRFGWDSMDAAIRTRLRSDWMNALADFTIDEVQEACRIALRNKAKDALNEETIAGIVLSSRARIVAALPKPAEQPTERKPIDKEAADRILAEAGFAPKKFGTI
tara:strand:- start:29073 stop:29468 length:396 start_codon:yes stop_codon:yes gene_type:complete